MNTYLHGEIKISTKNTLIYEFSCTSDPQTCHRECILRTGVRHSYVTQADAYRCVSRMRCRRTRGSRVWSSAQSSSPTFGTASTGPSAPSLVRVLCTLYRSTYTLVYTVGVLAEWSSEVAWDVWVWEVVRCAASVYSRRRQRARVLQSAGSALVPAGGAADRPAERHRP